MTLSFLLDENLSPETAGYLEALGYPCRSLRRDGPWRLSDLDVVGLARREGRIIITHDLDFGQIYYFAERNCPGILVLRLRTQTVEAVNALLGRFLRSAAIPEEDLSNSLVVLSESAYRVYRAPQGGPTGL